MCFVNAIFSIWAHSPIFALTDEKNFLAGRALNSCVFRFSVINIILGEIKIQLVSVIFENKRLLFDLFNVCYLSKMDSFNLNDEKVHDVEKSYNMHLVDIGDDLEIEKAALQRQL